MKSKQANILFVATCKSDQAYKDSRIRKLAHKVEPGEIGASIICRHLDYTARSVGRRAQGAHGTTTGGVWVNGRLVMRSVQTVTSKVKDAKSHKAQRVLNCDKAHTRAVDGLRTWTHISTPFRPGGYRWAKLGGVGKRRTRKLLYVCDRHVANGEVTVALELFRGS